MKQELAQFAQRKSGLLQSCGAGDLSGDEGVPLTQKLTLRSEVTESHLWVMSVSHGLPKEAFSRSGDFMVSPAFSPQG